MIKRILQWWADLCTHRDFEIVEYGNTQCVVKCDKCGKTFFWP